MPRRDNRPQQRTLTRQDVDEFELVEGQLSRFHTELLGMAKGKPNDVLNQFKLGLLNGLIGRTNAILGEGYVAVPGFSKFDPDQVPSVSDALLVVSQYLGALEKLRSDFIKLDYGSWFWMIDGEVSEHRAAPPERLSRK